MWVLAGPFDGLLGDLGTQKSKLLKTETSYIVSRKDGPLLINSKKVSHEHCEFVVGPFSVEDVADPSVRPRLEFVNKRTKMMKLLRQGKELAVNPATLTELEDGDALTIVTDIVIQIRWERLCCYVAPKSSSVPSASACADLGIHLTQIITPSITHHLVASFAMTAALAASLLSISHFARVEWLIEVLRLGSLPLNSDPASGLSLEHTFSLPLLSKFRPSFSAHLPPRFKEFKVWEPNEERTNMFAGLRFLLVGEPGREADGATKAMISHGGGEYEVLSITANASKWHHAVTKGLGRVRATGRGLFVLGDQAAIRSAVGDDGWGEILRILQSSQLRLISVQCVLEAVADVDVSRLASYPQDSDSSSSPLPSIVPNTLPEEPSMPPSSMSVLQVDPIIQQPSAIATPDSAPRPLRKLVRRATSRQPSQEPNAPPPTPSISEPEPTRTRRPLTRRAKDGGIPLIVGNDDPSVILNSSQILSPSIAPSDIPSDPSMQNAPRSSRLKRRAGTANTLDTQFLLGPLVTEAEQPPLKKFKALFDASDPDQPKGEQVVQSQTQTQSDPSNNKLAARQYPLLNDIQEEEESLPSLATDTLETRGTKRKAPAPESAIAQSASPQHLAKKQHLTDATSASTNLPDQDLAFLQALANKPGIGSAPEELDTDFQQLRVSHPELDDEARQWAVLEEFGDDSNLRGNFMVVVEMDLFRKDVSRASSTLALRPDQASIPNFKKFKKKSSEIRREFIPVLSEDDGFRSDEGIICGHIALIQSNLGLVKSVVPHPGDRDVGSPMAQTKPLKAESPSLFLDDSDSDAGVDNAPSLEDNLHIILDSPEDLPPPKAQAFKPKRVVLSRVVDADSDDEAVFRGFD